MGKFFPASSRHAKAWEFLKLKQGTMTVLEYVAKFTELARFADDYVATNIAKVRKFEDGYIEREINDTKSIRDAGTSDKRKEN